MTTGLRRWMFVYLMVCLFLATGQVSHARDIYVDGCATGHENGTEAYPYHTLSAAVAVAERFDNILMRGGSYPESLIIGKYLTITAYNGNALVGDNYPYESGSIDVSFPQYADVKSCTSDTKAHVYFPARCGILTDRGGPFPVVVYTHGFRDPRWELCGGGDFPYSGPVNEDFLQAEGILSRLAETGIIVISFDASCGGYSGVNRGALALNALAYLRNQNQPGGKLEGAVDLKRVGFLGHSVGGGASVYAATRLDDPRFDVLKLDTVQVKAVALIAPDFLDTDELLSELIEPTLIIYGTADKRCGIGFSSYYPSIYNEVNSAKKHLLSIAGANHFGYTDGLCVLGLPYLKVDPPSTVGGVTGPGAHFRQQLTAVNYIHAFFAHYLLGDSGMAEYLTQEGEQQCIAEFDPESDCIEHPINSGQPMRLFDDLEALNVEVSICSCLE